MSTPWWFPVLTDAAWMARLRKDYPDEAGDMDDDELREYYAGGWKYSDTWDHLGDARAEYQALADSYLEALAALERIAGLSAYADCECCSEIQSIARTAICKATGEQP
jgi:hypothetical protein